MSEQTKQKPEADSIVEKLLTSSVSEEQNFVSQEELEDFRNEVLEKEQQNIDIYSSANSGLITAIDIDRSNQNIEKIVEQRVKQYIKRRVRQIVKQLKDERAVKTNNADAVVSPEEITEITQQVSEDEETKDYRKGTFENIQSQKMNFAEMRKTMNGLNDLNEFSGTIEKLGFQKLERFFTFEALLNLSYKCNKHFGNIITERKDNIAKELSCLDKQLLTDFPMVTSSNGERIFDVQGTLNLLEEFYAIDKDVDDIELYERFDMLSNIDWSNRLSDVFGYFYKNANHFNNPLNEWHTNEDSIKQLTKRNSISNRTLYVLFGDKFVSTNRITVFDNTYTTTATNNKVYVTRTLGELLLMICNPRLKNISKEYRKQLYTSYNGIRPSSDEYYTWSGLQVYDIDLKTWNGNIDKLKKSMFELLQDFHWFLWICKSSSGKGLHIYTKVSPAHHVYTDPKENEYISKYWYSVSYLTKLNIVYSVLWKLSHQPESGIVFPETFENEFVDNTVGRITSGIRISFDETPLVNPNFVDLHPAVYLHQTLDGIKNKDSFEDLFFRTDDWESITDQRERKKLPNFINTSWLHRINDELAIGDLSVLKHAPAENSVDLSKYITTGGDATEIVPLDRHKINYISRYNVCNTLAALFGKDGLELAHIILDSKRCGNVREINAFYSCALSNKKQPSKLGLEILRQKGIIKTIDEKAQDVMENEFKSKLKEEIEQAINNVVSPADFEMKDEEYLSDFTAQLNKCLTNQKINTILSPAGSGKTAYILRLAKQGKRILLVLPYISVIRNKVETDPEVMNEFDCYYGTKDFREAEYGRNVVTTFDKFSRSNAEKLAHMFDYIMIDESHLLFTSSYRIEATQNVVKRLKELYFYSSNDPFAARICLFTGTATGEYVHFSKIGNFITFHKKSHQKQMEFLICDDTLDAITRLAGKSVELLNDGYRLMIPTNKGEIYSEKLVGMIEHLMGRTVKYGYYKRSNINEEICRMVNEQNTIGDYEIVFCSNYLSVGVDIIDNCKFASIYFGPFCAYEIEQFNARIRRTGIRSVYCLATNDSTGKTNELLLEEPNLVLKLTDEDQLRFLDDKSISHARQEFLAQYDPVLHKIVTPGFGVVNGKIDFKIEEYELISYENKFVEVMVHPLKVARELSRYGYEITVSTEFEGMSQKQQEELKKIGIASARLEKIRKHTLLVGTFRELIMQNTYINKNGLEFVGLIEWLYKNPDKVQEEREMNDFLKVTYDVFASPVNAFVRSREALEKMLKPARHLIKRYSPKRCIDIIEQFVDENGILKQKQFQRSINLLKLIESSDAGELSEPLTAMVHRIYEFVDNFESSPNYRISYDSYRTAVDSFTNSYLDMIGLKINTQFAYEKVRDSIVELINDIARKETSSAGIRFSYNKLPEQNSSAVLNRRSIDTLVETMFKLNSDVIDRENKFVRKKHVILERQEF